MPTCTLSRLLGLLLFLLGSLVGAQQQAVLRPSSDAPPDRSLKVELQQFSASRRPGGSGFLRVLLDNRHAEALEVRLELTTRDAPGLDLERRVSLEPGAQDLVEMVFPRLGHPLELRASLRSGTAVWFDEDLGVGSGAVGMLLVGARASLWSDAAGQAFDLSSVSKKLSRPTTEPDNLSPQQLPQDWRGLTGYDLIVADAGDPLCDGAALDLLLRYARAGGRLVIDRADRSRAPQLEALRKQRRQESTGARTNREIVPTGFGAVLLREAGDRTSLEADTLRGLRSLLFAPGPYALDGPLQAGRADPVPAHHFTNHALDSVATVPADVFLAIVLAFVLIVGPLNHVFLRRRGRAWLVLLTVPLAGALVTGGILVVTVALEGSEVRGERDTWTVLDQRSKHRTVHGRATLFAGISPGSVRPAATTWMTTSIVRANSAPSQLGADFDWRDARDAGRGALSGGLLPARRPLALLTIEDGGARDRLGFRKQASGDGIEILDGTRLRPKRAARAMVLTTPDGDHYVMNDAGLLVAATPTRAQDALAELRAASDPRGLTGPRPSGGVMPGSQPALAARMAYLEPGSYCCWLDGPPGELDELGLNVEWGPGKHLLFGRFSTEDLRDD